MIESLLEWLTLHIDQAPYIIFGLLVLTGLSIPISEDVMLIASGVLASTLSPLNTLFLFFGAFLGCFVSDCIAYFMGYHFGHKKPSRKRFFSLSEARIQRLKTFYEKYGTLTLFFGRFIPFGVRNGIFMMAGAGKMSFWRFALVDISSCLLFSTIVFSFAYYSATTYESLHNTLHSISLGILVIFFTGLVCYFLIRKYCKKQVKGQIH